MDVDERPLFNVATVKTLILRAWRERWTDEKWSVCLKPYLSASTRDNSPLAEILLQQGLVGSTPNAQLFSYLKYAINTQMVTVSMTIGELVKFVDIGRLYCIQALFSVVETFINSISCSEDSSNLARSFLTLLIWVYDLILRAIQGLTGDPKAAQIGGAHEVSSSQTLVEKSCEVVGLLADCRSVCALVHIALSDSPELSQQLEQLLYNIQMILGNTHPDLSSDLKQLTSEALKRQTSFKEVVLKRQPLLDTTSQLMNIGINILVSTEAVLRPTNDILPLVEQILLIEAMQGCSRSHLYCELFRACLMGMADAVGKPDEIKWAAFTYLKLPPVIQRLAQTGAGTVMERQQKLEEGLDELLQYIPLLDLADTKCSCECLQFLLHELRSKHAVITEAQCRKVLSKRQGQSLKMKLSDTSNGSQTPSLILRAEPTVSSILKTLDSDYSKNQEALLGILCQMMSGKSFELILSAAAATGKLQSFALKLIRFNEFAKQTTGENNKSAQTRALLFDISFLMLCHITQLYGSDVIVSSPECASTLFVQWIVQCLPEDGKYKSVDLIGPPDQNKVDVLLSQFNPSGELKTNLTRWNEVCHNAPYAIQEVLWAWECGNLQQENIKSIMDSVKGTMCCLPVVVSAWLCSHISISDTNIRLKATYMLTQLLILLPSPDANNLYYTERSMLMQVILSKMVHDLLPAASIPRPYAFAFAIPAKMPTHDVLIETFRYVLSKGYICIDNIQKMDYLLNVGGAQWFCDHLVREVLTYDRLEYLYKGIGLLYSLFHMDLDNITLCLIHHTVPTLLQSTGPTLKLLSDPRGLALAKLCVMCLTVVHKMRQKTKGGEMPGVQHTRKRTIAEIQLETDEYVGDDDVTCKQRRMGSSPLDMEEDDDSLILNNDNFGGLRDFLSCSEKETEPESTPHYDSKDLLNRTIVNLFRLFSGVLIDKVVNQRTGFVLSFIRETLKTGSVTSRFILQFMSLNMVNQLFKIIPNEITTDVLLHLCDVTTVVGRRAAARVVCLNARHLLASHSNGTSTSSSVGVER